MHKDRPHFDIYEKVTSLIIEQLEKGIIPWRKPWHEAGLPMNLLTRRAYTGINFLLLNALPYEQQYYMTFNQLKAVGGSVLGGEKGHMVVLTKKMEMPDKEDETKNVRKTLLQYYFVFNISQCRDIPSHLLPVGVKHIESEPISICEFIVEDMPYAPEIRHEEATAYYVPSMDYINMPPMGMFQNSEEYYNTLWHELVHSTGHESRLNRTEVMESNEFGSLPYSLEELVAEMGACYISAYCGIANRDISNNVAYIQSWLEVLRKDKRFIVQAASRAQHAVDYILDFVKTSSEVERAPAEEME